VEAPILTYPDPTKQYILDTDASDHRMGGPYCPRYKEALR